MLTPRARHAVSTPSTRLPAQARDDFKKEDSEVRPSRYVGDNNARWPTGGVFRCFSQLIGWQGARQEGSGATQRHLPRAQGLTGGLKLTPPGRCTTTSLEDQGKVEPT